jgi:hypothetical protein
MLVDAYYDLGVLDLQRGDRREREKFREARAIDGLTPACSDSSGSPPLREEELDLLYRIFVIPADAMSETPHEEPVLFDLPLAPGRTGETGTAAGPARRIRRPSANGPTAAVHRRGAEAGAGRNARRERRARRGEPSALRRGCARWWPSRRCRRDLAPLGPRLRPRPRPASCRSGGDVGDRRGRARSARQSPRRCAGIGVFLLAWASLLRRLARVLGTDPGMAWAGLVARGRESEPLSSGQTARRRWPPG